MCSTCLVYTVIYIDRHHNCHSSVKRLVATLRQATLGCQRHCNDCSMAGTVRQLDLDTDTHADIILLESDENIQFIGYLFAFLTEWLPN